MKKLLGILFLGLLWCNTLFAETTNLKCKIKNTQEWNVKVKINLSQNLMQMGDSKYKIISVNDEYITGLSYHSSAIGGEVWTLDRTTGKYYRALVANVCQNNECTKHKVEAITYEGICKTKIF